MRRFADRPVDRPTLERLVEAAATAPSSTNRQPWRFAVLTGEPRQRAVDAVRRRADELRTAIAAGPHGDEFGGYGDFFWEPLATAAAIVVPQVRTFPDLVAGFLASAGADPSRFSTPAAMPMELCATSAAVMALLLQAHAERLGACWTAGPMVARTEIEALAAIEPPWRMLGAVAIGHPVEAPSSPPRRPLDRVITWIDS